MLSGIHPLLNGKLLLALDQMGHGDAVVVADANFPAHQLGLDVLDLPGLAAASVTQAIRTVFPLDTFEGPSVTLMSTADGARVAVQEELVTAAAAPDDRVSEVERFAFYDLAAEASLVIRTGESRSYGNVVLRKGVVTGPAAELPPA